MTSTELALSASTPLVPRTSIFAHGAERGGRTNASHCPRNLCAQLHGMEGGQHPAGLG